jgi:hypothetical protein
MQDLHDARIERLENSVIAILQMIRCIASDELQAAKLRLAALNAMTLIGNAAKSSDNIDD